MNKIYIPTLGRYGHQITWDNLPTFLKDITVFVIQPKEKKYFLGRPYIVLPKNNIGISNTRKWVWEQGHDQIYGVFDDDLEFMKRNLKGQPSKLPMTENDWKTVLNETMNWITNEYSFSGFRRNNLPPKKTKWDDNKECLQAVFYNGRKLPKVNEIDWKSNLYAEDVRLHLQLLIQGHKNRVWNIYGMSSYQFTKGGCQSDTFISPNGRTPKDIDNSHESMVKSYYPFVQYIKKKGQIVRNSDGSRKIKIFYNKAYRNGGLGNLLDFIE